MQIEAKNITMEYKGKAALKGLNFTLEEGIYGLLGANGAGKSTLIRILTGAQRPTTGEVFVDGAKLLKGDPAYLRRLGYVPQQQSLYPEMTAEQFLFYIAKLKQINQKQARQQVEELLSRVNLYEVRKKRLGGFSGGMRQRVMIAQALLGNPDFVIFDEPTAGLDPKERIRIRNLISELSFHKTVLIATHIVTDIEFISKEILVLNKGYLLQKNTPEGLLREIENHVFELQMSEEQYTQFRDTNRITNVQKRGQGICLRVLMDEAERDQVSCIAAEKVQPDLEDYYLYLFGREELEAWENGR